MSLKASNILVVVGYTIAFIVGAIGYLLLGQALDTNNLLLEIIIKSAFMDVIATIIVYLIALFLKNTSYYDPYWSVWPFVMVLWPLIVEDGLWNLTSIFCLVVVTIYSHRLTINWAIRFKGFTKDEEDYRYKHYRDTLKPFLFELVNFFGLIMFPTVLVFLGTIPLFYAIVYGSPFNPLYIIGLLITLLGVGFEILADIPLIKHRKDPSKRGTLLNVGLWKYSRHPNYLGEVTIWFGFAMTGLTITLVNKLYNQIWIVLLGAFLIFLLFFFISVPLMDNRMLKRHEDYKEYMEKTSRLFILPRRK